MERQASAVTLPAARVLNPRSDWADALALLNTFDDATALQAIRTFVAECHGRAKQAGQHWPAGMILKLDDLLTVAIVKAGGAA